jgi:HSP20 family protein
MKKLMKSNGSLFPAIPSLVDDLFTKDWFSSLATLGTSGTTLPDVNVMETNDEFKIEVAAPGMKPGDFTVELDNNVLTISAQREDNREEKDEKGNYTHREFSYQTFQRSFSMPENKVEGEKISARYADGILYVTVPKKEEARTKPAKRIAVA